MNWLSTGQVPDFSCPLFHSPIPGEGIIKYSKFPLFPRREMLSENWIYYRPRLCFSKHDFSVLTRFWLQAVHIPWHRLYFLFPSRSPGFLPGAPLQKFRPALDLSLVISWCEVELRLPLSSLEWQTCFPCF